ncbi:MAG: DUF484 family protein [Rhodospirillaceae bacterium]|nr:MAG: DUF484 family protein [Rhodospirillaceae bacterium]
MADRQKAGTGPELREQDVIAYLLRNPRFLAAHPELIAPEGRFETDAVVVDMQRFVVERLRRQVDDLKASTDRIVTNTRSNMSLVERTLECALALLYARDFNELGQILNDDLPAHLGIDAVAIGFESDHLPADAGQIVKALPQGTLHGLMGNDPSTRIRSQTDGDVMLYGSSAGIVRSDALVALVEGEGMPPGIFAVGCRTPGHFEPGQGTELIAFLAHVTRYAVGRWWTLQL